MNFRKVIIFCVSVTWLGPALQAQDNTIFEDDRLNYNREIHGGILFHNYGWGLNFSKYFHQTVDKQRYFEIQFSFVHHPKQQKVISYFSQDARGYYFGKLNTFFVFRGLYGKKHIIGHKLRSNGVELAVKWGVGPSLGFLKPVYLEVFYDDLAFPVAERYDPNKHNQNNIYGRAGGLKGFNEIMFRPGVFAKLGLQVELSTKKEGVFGIEAGLALDAYFQPVEIMAYIDNMQIFPVLYIDIFFGKKFNQM